MIRIGTICSFSQPLAHSPMMKPNRLNVTDVSTRNASIQTGCSMWNGTNSRAVDMMIKPSRIDLVAAAPT